MNRFSPKVVNLEREIVKLREDLEVGLSFIFLFVTFPDANNTLPMCISTFIPFVFLLSKAASASGRSVDVADIQDKLDKKMAMKTTEMRGVMRDWLKAVFVWQRRAYFVNSKSVTLNERNQN